MMKNLILNVADALGLAVWVEIITTNPKCTYFFGPFTGTQEAEIAKAGYVEDLLGEGARIISIEVKRCKPKELTIVDDREEPTSLQQFSSISS